MNIQTTMVHHLFFK